MTALAWGPRNVARRMAGCQHCGGSTYLRDDNGVPAHKVCAEQATTHALNDQVQAATAVYQTSTIGEPE